MAAKLNRISFNSVSSRVLRSLQRFQLMVPTQVRDGHQLNSIRLHNKRNEVEQKFNKHWPSIMEAHST